MNRRRLLALVLGLLALAAGCGVPSDSSPRTITSDPLLADILKPRGTTPDDAPDVSGRVAELYFVEEGRLVAVHRQVSQLTPQAILSELVAGQPPGTGARSAIPGGTTIKDATLEEATLIVTLSDEITRLGNPDQKLAFAQLVFTATALTDVRSVRFFSEDANGQRDPLSPPTDGANATDRPVTRGDYLQVMPTTTTTTSTTQPGDTSSTTTTTQPAR